MDRPQGFQSGSSGSARRVAPVRVEVAPEPAPLFETPADRPDPSQYVTEVHDTHTLIHIRPSRGAVVLNPDGSIAYYKRNQFV